MIWNYIIYTILGVVGIYYTIKTIIDLMPFIREAWTEE
jgi:hypothetical protein